MYGEIIGTLSQTFFLVFFASFLFKFYFFAKLYTIVAIRARRTVDVICLDVIQIVVKLLLHDWVTSKLMNVTIICALTYIVLYPLFVDTVGLCAEHSTVRWDAHIGAYYFNVCVCVCFITNMLSLIVCWSPQVTLARVSLVFLLFCLVICAPHRVTESLQSKPFRMRISFDITSIIIVE